MTEEEMLAMEEFFLDSFIRPLNARGLVLFFLKAQAAQNADVKVFFQNKIQSLDNEKTQKDTDYTSRRKRLNDLRQKL